MQFSQTCPPRPHLVYSPESAPTLTETTTSAIGCTRIYNARGHLRRHALAAR